MRDVFDPHLFGEQFGSCVGLIPCLALSRTRRLGLSAAQPRL